MRSLEEYKRIAKYIDVDVDLFVQCLTDAKLYAEMYGHDDDLHLELVKAGYNTDLAYYVFARYEWLVNEPVIVAHVLFNYTSATTQKFTGQTMTFTAYNELAVREKFKQVVITIVRMYPSALGVRDFAVATCGNGKWAIHDVNDMGLQEWYEREVAWTQKLREENMLYLNGSLNTQPAPEDWEVE